MIIKALKEFTKQSSIVPDHDILFENIKVCPIDDHVTFGIEATNNIIDTNIIDVATNTNFLLLK